MNHRCKRYFYLTAEGTWNSRETLTIKRCLGELLAVLMFGMLRAQELGIEDPDSPFLQQVAGTGIAGALDQGVGNGLAAQFYRPEGVAVDSRGNILLADTENRLIRWIGLDGEVRTIAGQARVDGVRDGLGKDSQFSGPSSVAVASDGNIFVADSSSHLIRKIDPAGNVSTVAGTAWRAGYAEGHGTNALFSIPAGVALDAAGNLYVADRLNHVIRKVSQSGDVELFAGVPRQSGFADGPKGVGRLNAPTAVAAAGGFVYVADTSNNAIRKLHADGFVETIGGIRGRFGYRDGGAAESDFNYPRGVAVDPFGQVYVADTGNHVIRKIRPNGFVTTVAGLGGVAGSYEGTGVSARLNEARGIAMAPDGSLIVADTWNHRVCRLNVGLTGGGFENPTRLGRPGLPFEIVFHPAGDSWTWSWVRKPSGSTLELPPLGSTRFSLIPDRVGLFTLRAATMDGAGRVNWRHVELMVVERLELEPPRAHGGAPPTLRVPGGPGIGGHLEVWLEGQWRYFGRKALPLAENEFVDPFPTQDAMRFYRIKFLPTP